MTVTEDQQTEQRAQKLLQILQFAETREVPATAMQFEAQLQFADGEMDGAKTAPIKMLGRSAEPIYHWYWGKIIHDMAGFKADHDKVPIDWSHDAYKDEGIGYLDKFKADNNGLHVEGELVSIEDGDRASTIMKKSAAGIPYQASIFFRPEVVEEVQAGASSKVNGYTVEGPATIVRQWSLRGVAICLYGADHRTQSQFSDDGEQKIAVSYFKSESPMSTAPNSQTPAQTNTQNPAQLEGKPAEGTQLTETGKPSGKAEGKSTETELTANDGKEKDGKDKVELSAGADRSELKRFIEKFGAQNGAQWFADNVSFADAMEKHIDALNAASADKDKQIKELNDKFASIDRGEKEPLKFGSNDASDKSSEVPKQFQQLGDNVGRFAAGIKLPK